MTLVPCSRLWEAEALEEGRLSGSDRASFERHSATCAACRTEREAFAALKSTLSSIEAPTMITIARQRARAQLLQRANAGVLHPSLPLRVQNHLRSAPIGTAIAALFLLAGVASGFVILQARHSPPNVGEAIGPSPSTPAFAAAAAPRFDAQSSAEAVWLPRTEGSTTTVTLRRGTVSFTVPHLEPPQRFFVTLPDGELEVRGTRFTVAVDAELGAPTRTTRIQVTEGRVLLRMKGEPDGTLFAGEVWVPPDPMAALPAASTMDLTQRHAAAVAVPTSAAAAAHSSALPTASTPRAGALFDAAVASFESGAYERADAQLADFARDYPTDPRAEDASYLRAVSHWHLGDRPAALRLARAYLDTYPGGLRRPEAARILEASAQR